MPYVRIGPSRNTSILMRTFGRRAPFRFLFPSFKTYPSGRSFPGPGAPLV